MRVLSRPISHFGPIAWSDTETVFDDRSREKGTSVPVVPSCRVREYGRKIASGSSEGLLVGQSGKANAQAVGRRTTASIVKGATAGIADRGVADRKARFCSMVEAYYSQGSKWEDAPASSDGVKGGGMCGRFFQSTGEARRGSLRIRIGIRDEAESRSEALSGVGDGHSTVDPKDNKTFGEERAISLECLCLKEGPA